MITENILLSTIEKNTGIIRYDIRNTSQVGQNMALDTALADTSKSTQNNLVIETGKDLIQGKNFVAYS